MNIPPEAIRAAARALAHIEPDDDWPTNTELGGHSVLGTRDDEYRWAMEQEARAVLEVVFPYLAAPAWERGYDAARVALHPMHRSDALPINPYRKGKTGE